METTTIAAIVVVGIAILAAVYWMQSTLREEFEDATDYVDSEEETTQKGGVSIPITARASGLSGTAKLLFASLGGIILIIGVFAFQTIRTGSPAEMLFADQLITGGTVLFGAVLGIIAVNWSQQAEGTLYNVYETESGDVRTEEVPVNVSGMRANDEGQPVVTEYANTRVAGLFRRVRHVGEDATLAGTHRAPGKPVTHQIPDHAVEVDDGVWVNRTEQRRRTDSPDTEADYIYASPVELSYDRYMDLKEAKRRMDTRMKSLESTVSVLEKELEKLTQRLKSGQYKEEDEILDKIDRIADIVDLSAEADAGDNSPRATHVSMNGESAGANHQQAATDGGSQ